MSRAETVICFNNWLLKKPGDELVSVTFNGDWQNPENVREPQLFPVAKLSPGPGSANIVLVMSTPAQNHRVRCVAFLNTTLEPYMINGIDFDNPSSPSSVSSYEMMQIRSSNGYNHLIFVFDNTIETTWFRIRMDGGFFSTVEIGSLFVGDALYSTEIEDARWSLKYNDTANIEYSSGKQTFPSDDGKLFKTIDIPISNIDVTEAYGRAIVGRDVKPSNITTSNLNLLNGGWYLATANSGSLGLTYPTPETSYLIDFNFTSTSSNENDNQSSLAFNIAEIQTLIPGRYVRTIVTTNSNFSFTMSYSKASTANVRIRVNSFRPIVKNASPNTNLEKVYQLSGFSKPIIYFGRYKEASWQDALCIYGRITKTSPILHSKANFFSTTMTVEEYL